VLIELPTVWIIVLNVGGWVAVQMGLAWAFTKMPVEWFESGKPRAWERTGRFYERVLRIKAWKDSLPDGAGWFSGGFPKGTLAGMNRDYLARIFHQRERDDVDE